MLRTENLTWREVWGPIQAAASKGVSANFAFNVTDFSFSHETGMVVVGGLVDEEGEAHVHIDDFARAVGPFLRGAPR